MVLAAALEQPPAEVGNATSFGCASAALEVDQIGKVAVARDLAEIAVKPLASEGLERRRRRVRHEDRLRVAALSRGFHAVSSEDIGGQVHRNVGRRTPQVGNS